MKKLLFVSLGCDKNLVDSERMLAGLLKHGYEMTDDESEAEVIIINTCCFIHDAQDESVENILAMAEYKKSGSCKALIVTGCMAQMFGKDILEELPEVDAVLGTGDFDKILEAVDKAYEGVRMAETGRKDSLPSGMKDRVSVTGGFSEYLKIAEGCDKHCTYCVIPSLRGSYRSVPMEELVAEAEKLAENGTRELNLVAQETTVYGKDLYGEKSLHILLKKLAAIEDIKWIRVLYCYPEEIYPELIDTIALEPKICRYLDLPIQHCNDEILRKMGRRTSREGLLDIISKLRAAMPDIALRTSLITGFPGETAEQHEELKQFVKEVRFDRLGVFTYSREDGTPAAAMPDQIDEEIKTERREEIMLLQQEISAEKGREKIGSETEVFIEGYMPEDGTYIGRTRADAPSVDGYIFVESEKELCTGDIVRCVINGANEYDLTGEIRYESAE